MLSLSGEGSYEPVARSCRGGGRQIPGQIPGWIPGEVCPGMYGESSRPILMKVCRIFTGIVQLCMPQYEKNWWTPSWFLGDDQNFPQRIIDYSTDLSPVLSASGVIVYWGCSSVSGPGSVPILVYRARYLKTDKSVHSLVELV